MARIDERSIAGFFELAAGNGAGRRGVYIWRLLGGVIVVLGLALPLLALWDGVWPYHWEQWRWSAQFPLYAMLFLPWILGLGWFPWETVTAAVNRLWRAAVEGNDTLAPLAAEQPEPSSEGAQIGAIEVLGPLRGTKDSMRLVMYWLAAVIMMLLAMLCGILAALQASSVANASHLSVPDMLLAYAPMILFSLLAPMMFTFSIMLALQVRRLGRGLSVAADETGVRWRDTRWRSGERRIAWSEAEAFITIMCRGSGEPPTRVYALKAGGATLLWSVKASISRQEQAAADRLRRLIVTRTRLPLRDLTAISRVVVDELIRVSLRRGTRSVAGAAQSPGTAALLDAILPHDYIGEAARKARRLQVAGLWVSLPYTVLIVINAVVPWFQGKQ